MEKLDLFLSGRSLPNVDTTSKTDSFAAVYLHNVGESRTYLSGITSVVMDHLNPAWPDAIPLDFVFQSVQEITVKIYHLNPNFPRFEIEKHLLIGETKFKLAELMLKKFQASELDIIMNSKSIGKLLVRGEAQISSRDMFVGTFEGAKLVNTPNFNGNSDPMIIISRINEDGSWTVVYRSDHVKGNLLNPTWPSIRIRLSTLCNCDLYRLLRLEVWDIDKDFNHQLIGFSETNPRTLLENNGVPFSLIDKEVKFKDASYENSGTLIASQVSIQQIPCFLDYLRGGLEMNLIVAIDFTGSNGNPKNKASLHYLHPNSKATTDAKSKTSSSVPPPIPPSNMNEKLIIPNIPEDESQLNEYEAAILSVGTVLEPYDSDKIFGLHGFGAKINHADGKIDDVNHNFAVSLDGNFQVNGLDGIFKAYQDCIHHVELSGPTHFAPVIRAAKKSAADSKCSQERQRYTILLILTDGVIDDMTATESAIKECCSDPISIIIVGVGHADFTKMKKLDDLIQGAARDIVQFVPYREKMSEGKTSLAAEVLAEVPTQVIEYMESKSIIPNVPV